MAKRRFDQSANRVDYGELLIEDPTYELEQAVGMTYSLDMEALMGIPLCLGMRGEMTSGQGKNPLYVLEAIRRTGEKLSIFCNAGCIKVPKSESKLFALLESSIHEVRMPEHTYNFHPKVWIVQYRNVEDGKILIKVVIMSRNLTFDQSMDIAIEMKGYVGEGYNAKNQPLADLLTFVAQFDENKGAYDNLISNVLKVDGFELLDCFSDYEFHPFGIYGNPLNGIEKIVPKGKITLARDLFCNCNSLFIISPFLTESVINELLDASNPSLDARPWNRCLVTRETSVTKKIFNAFNTKKDDELNGIYKVNPIFSSNDALEDEETYGYASRDVHAKVYYTEKYGESNKLYIGSLNASKNAFDNNVEFLLELDYKSRYSSYKSIVRDFIPEEESPFLKMLNFSEDLIVGEEKVVDFRQEVYGVQGARVINKGEYNEIEVYALNDYSGVAIRPFFVKTQAKPLTKITKFENVSLSSLSSIFVLSKDGVECLVRLNVKDMPVVMRDDAIFNEIISNMPMLMTYMRYLLDEDFYDSVSLELLDMAQVNDGKNNDGYGFTVEPDLYERMLRAAAEHPERFDSMYEVVSRLDDDKIGEDFKKLLELFMDTTGRKGICQK